MSRGSITNAVNSGRLLVADGAWGTVMQGKGLKPGECHELWSLERPEDIRLIARGYVEAGADIIGTNSFGANRPKLERYGLGARAAELNEAAARLSRAEAGDGVRVMGSMGSTGKLLIMEDITGEELYAVYKEQAEALERGGADAVCVETMSDIEEACIAVRATRENTGLEVICSFTFERTVKGEYRTIMGATPARAALAAVEAGAHIIGTNCGGGADSMAYIVAELRETCPDIPLLAKPNAGLPRRLDGRDVYPATPEDMAACAAELARAGAAIIGGCCGTTPEHIRAIKQVVLLKNN